MQNDSQPSTGQHILFVTGQLAESAVRQCVQTVADKVGFEYSIAVMPITVAALMTPKWLLRKLQVPEHVTRVIVPGYLETGLEELRASLQLPVDCGPRDIRNLSEFFGKKRENNADLQQYSIEILAEINHASALTVDVLLARALDLQKQGADVIDLGCTPGLIWRDVGTAVRELRDAGMRVSIDSFEREEVEMACRAGAELVLSVNSSNCDYAIDLNAEVVVVPDWPDEEKKFFETINFLHSRGVKVRVDPILEPIGCGFAHALDRYTRVRKLFEQLPMMMGIGNVTELTDVDSAGINMLLLGICEELRIESVLTTNVINWARSSIQECDIARRSVHYAVQHRIPPKRVDDRLVLLRDPKLNRYSDEVLADLAESIRDTNVRLIVQDNTIHFLAAGFHFRGSDPMQIFNEVMASPLAAKIDASHAFYLGYEMSKALTAITLDKQYEQDEPLRWGFLTRHEKSHRLNRRPKPKSENR